MPITAKVETITPEKARKILAENNTNNYRPLNENAAQSFAAVIKNGKWELNGESIKFNGDGTLLDGQTRLRGADLANTSFTTLVVRGVETDESIDSGRPRSLHSVLSRRGEKNAKTLAGALGWLYTHKMSWHINARYYASNVSLLTLLSEEPKIRQACAFVATHLDRRSSVGKIEMFSFLFHEFRKKDQPCAEHYIKNLGSGIGLGPEDPVRFLRERLIRNRSSKAKLLRTEACALAIIAWNGHRAGRLVRQLKWTASGPTAQMFPTID